MNRYTHTRAPRAHQHQHQVRIYGCWVFCVKERNVLSARCLLAAECRRTPDACCTRCGGPKSSSDHQSADQSAVRSPRSATSSSLSHSLALMKHMLLGSEIVVANKMPKDPRVTNLFSFFFFCKAVRIHCCVCAILFLFLLSDERPLKHLTYIYVQHIIL